MDTHQHIDSSVITSSGFVSSTPSAKQSIDLEKTRMLAWQMLDEAISPEEMAQLESDLQACPEARRAYLDVMQLESELKNFFSVKRS